MGLLSFGVCDQFEDVLWELSGLIAMRIISGTNINLFPVSCMTKTHLFSITPNQLSKLSGSGCKSMLVKVIFFYFVVPHFGSTFIISLLKFIAIIIKTCKVFAVIISFFYRCMSQIVNFEKMLGPFLGRCDDVGVKLEWRYPMESPILIVLFNLRLVEG